VRFLSKGRDPVLREQSGRRRSRFSAGRRRPDGTILLSPISGNDCRPPRRTEGGSGRLTGNRIADAEKRDQRDRLDAAGFDPGRIGKYAGGLGILAERLFSGCRAARKLCSSPADRARPEFRSNSALDHSPIPDPLKISGKFSGPHHKHPDALGAKTFGFPARLRFPEWGVPSILETLYQSEMKITRLRSAF
jgi:hypothetical protein